MSLADKAIEIVSYPASEAYQKDVHEVDGALKVLRSKTSHPFWVGLGTKKPKLHGFIPWNTIEDHQASIASPEFEAIKAGLGPTFADPSNPQINVVHLTFTSDPTPALSSPITELWYITPKPGVSLSEIQGKLDEITEALFKAEESGAAARASIAEKPGEVALLIGWKAADVRLGLVWSLVDETYLSKLIQANVALAEKECAERRDEFKSKVDITAVTLKLTKSDI